MARVIVDPLLLALLNTIIETHHDGASQYWPVGGDLVGIPMWVRDLPIENPTSQFLADVYLHPLDDFEKHEL